MVNHAVTECCVSNNWLDDSVFPRAALRQLADTRGRCNAFFLEVVSRFCLSEAQTPSEEVVELLFSLLISASGQ